MKKKRQMNHKVGACSKVWIQKGDVVFGEGRYQLFKAIEDTGSISKGAQRLGMSYRGAWGKIKATEERLGIVLIEKQAGGVNGGATLTPECIQLIKAYACFKDEANAMVDRLYEKHFSQLTALKELYEK